MKIKRFPINPLLRILFSTLLAAPGFAQVSSSPGEDGSPGAYYAPLTPKSTAAQNDRFKNSRILTTRDIYRAGAVVHGIDIGPATLLQPVSANVSTPAPKAVVSANDYTQNARDFVAASIDGVISPLTNGGDPFNHAKAANWLEGINSVAETNQSESDLLSAIRLIDNMVRSATPIRNASGNTRLIWAGGRSGGLYDSFRELSIYQTAAEIARTAAIMAMNAAWRVKYSSKIQSYVNLLKDMVVGGYLTDIYKGRFPTGSTRDTAWSAKASYLGAMAVQLFRATQDLSMKTLATELGLAFASRLRTRNNGWAWDQDGQIKINSDYGPDLLPPGVVDVGNIEGAPDTMQAGGAVKMMVYLYEAGLVFSLADVQRMGATLTETIWDPKTNSFANYVNGSQKAFRTASRPGENGIVASGWSLLARFHQGTQNLLEHYFNRFLFDSSNNSNAGLAPNRANGGRATLAANLSRFKTDGFLLRPVVPQGFLNGATGRPGKFTSGGMVTVVLKEPPQEGLEVWVNGQLVKISSIKGQEVTFVMPSGLVAGRNVTIQFKNSGIVIGEFGPRIEPSDPGIFPGGVFNSDFTTNSEGSPVQADGYISLYTTGLELPEGWTIFGVIHDREDLIPSFSGATMYPGVQQINLQVPSNLPTMQSEVKICAREPGDGGRTICSPPANIFIQARPEENP